MPRDARPATAEDLKQLLRGLHEEGVDYLLIGGYALFALGYQRGTVDIDLLLPRSQETGERVKRALLLLPDKAARDIDLSWFLEDENIRVADEFVVDLMFNAGGETYESLQPYAVTVDFDGVPVRTLNLEGLLKTKQSDRERDRLDRLAIERALEEAKKSGPA
jgi:hypothetical protein